jgi:hypothetical protein
MDRDRLDCDKPSGWRVIGTGLINPARNLIRDSKDLAVSGGTPIVAG